MTVDYVADIAALQLYTGSAKTVIVQDKARGGTFNFFTAGTPDDGIVFAANPLIPGGPGFWYRDITNAEGYNVKWYGALGNGGTSNDDQPAIQAAIDAAHLTYGTTNEGGVVFVPSGVYFIKKTLDLPMGVHFKGAGHRNTIIQASSSHTITDAIMTSGLTTTFQHDIRISEVWLRATNGVSRGLNIAAWNEGCTLDNIQVSDASLEGIRIGKSVPPPPPPTIAAAITQNVSFGRIRITSLAAGADALVLDNVCQCTFDGISVDQPSTAPGASKRGILFTNSCNQNILMNVNLEDCSIPIQADNQFNENIISGLHINNPSFSPTSSTVGGITGTFGVIIKNSTTGYIINGYKCNSPITPYDYDLIDVQAGNKAVTFGTGTQHLFTQLLVGRDANNNLVWVSDRETILFPRMTQAQRDALVTPATGSMVFNTDTNQLNVYYLSGWKILNAQMIGTGNTTDTVTKAFLNTNYPVANYPIGTVVAYYNQNKRFERVTAMDWILIATTLMT